MIEGERRGRALFYSEETILLEIHGVSKLEYELESIFLGKWTLSITITRIGHVKKGGSFVLFPYFFVVLDKSGMHFEEWTLPLKCMSGVSWIRPR